jgi:hypothetical protein
MHSEGIDHRARTRVTSKLLSRRNLLLCGTALGAGTALAGCGNGTSREAARGREEDAVNESVVKDLQATETWNLVNATPPPGTQMPDGGE